MRLLLCWLTVLCVTATALCAEEIRIDFVMERDPEIIPVPTVMVFSPKVLPLWLEALARPEAQMQRMAAEAIADAHAFDLPDIEKAKPGLIKIVSGDATNAAARFSAARTLIVMDAKDAAAALFEASQKHGADLRQHGAALTALLERFGNPEIDDLRHRLAVVAGDQHVRRLEIAMDHALLVGVLHRLAHGQE